MHHLLVLLVTGAAAQPNADQLEDLGRCAKETYYRCVCDSNPAAVLSPDAYSPAVSQRLLVTHR